MASRLGGIGGEAESQPCKQYADNGHRGFFRGHGLFSFNLLARPSGGAVLAEDFKSVQYTRQWIGQKVGDGRVKLHSRA
jgi:hypothetical protein